MEVYVFFINKKRLPLHPHPNVTKKRRGYVETVTLYRPLPPPSDQDSFNLNFFKWQINPNRFPELFCLLLLLFIRRIGKLLFSLPLFLFPLPFLSPWLFSLTRLPTRLCLTYFALAPHLLFQTLRNYRFLLLRFFFLGDFFFFWPWKRGVESGSKKKKRRNKTHFLAEVKFTTGLLYIFRIFFPYRWY